MNIQKLLPTRHIKNSGFVPLLVLAKLTNNLSSLVGLQLAKPTTNKQIVFEADKIEDVSHYEKNALQFSKLIDNEYFTIFEVITIIGEKKKLYKKTALPSKLCLLVKTVKNIISYKLFSFLKKVAIPVSMFLQSDEASLYLHFLLKLKHFLRFMFSFLYLEV